MIEERPPEAVPHTPSDDQRVVARTQTALRCFAERIPQQPPRATLVALTSPDGRFTMCVKPYAWDDEGRPSLLCSSKPAHHDGVCGPWMPEVQRWATLPPRDEQGRIVNFDDLDLGRFGDPL